jgi:T5SS/PEP-CTERM-associated repeat protein
MGMVAVGEDSSDGTAGSGTIRFDDNPGMVSDSTSLGVDQGTQGSVQMDTGDWDNTGDLTVGDAGEGDLDLSDDASLTVGGDLDEAEQDDSAGDASIDDSTIGITGALTVGDDGTGTFDISDGGQVTAASLTIAAQDDAGTADDPSTVTVDGDGSTLTIEGDAEVGGQAYGALIVSDGANATIDGTLNVDQNFNGLVQVAAASTTTVMDDADVANMAMALVQVQGTFEVQGDTTIGVDAGSQGTIVIEGDGATMTTTDLTVGAQGTGTLMLSGDSTSLSVGGDLVVGDSGTGVMVVAGGAALSVSGETITVAMEAGSNATLTFNAADFTYAGTIVVGDQGNGALFVQLGANITVDSIQAGATQGAIGQLNVDSAVLTINDDLTVGSAGAGTLNLTDGAMVLVGSDATFGETGVGVVQRLSIDTGAILAIDGDFKFGDGGIAAGIVQGGGQIGVSGTATLGGQTNASGVLTLTGNDATQAGGTAANLAYGDALVVGESGFGTLDILQGATVAPLMANPGSHDVAIGAAAGGSGTVVVDGAASLLSANTLAVGGSVARPGGSGTLVVSDGGLVQAVDVTVWASGVISLQGGTIETDPMTIIGTVSGPGVITGDVTDDGTVIATGGTLDLTGTVSGPGALVIDPESELDLGGDQGTGITFAPGGNETLAIDAPFSDFTAVSGLANGDAIVVAGSAEVTAQISYGSTSTTVSLLQNGADVGGFLLAGSYAPGSLQTSTSGDTLTVTEIPCFLAGTAIATARGEQVVEALRIGDTVWLADGGTAAIVWIGDRRADAWRHPDPDAVLPIRITAGACGPGQPRRDLLVSPDHAVCLDGMLIPARLLVNGNSIRQDRRIGRPHYYHVELHRHAVLLAEGLPAESYLDTGNRAAFAAGRGVAALWPDFAGGDRGGRSCLPFVTDPARVRPIWQRLAGRDADAVADPPAIAAPVLLADSVAIAPVMTGETLSYALPPRCRAAWLVSAVRRPSDAAPWLDDRRALGVCVSRIALVGADDTRVIAPDDPALADGWWPAEADGLRHWRWTRDAAAIPLRTDTVVVQVKMVGLRVAAADTERLGRSPLRVRRCAGGDGSPRVISGTPGSALTTL